MSDRECIALMQAILPRLGLRWRGFSNVRGQVCKRISRRAREVDAPDAADYRRRLEEDPLELAEFDRLCRVTISRFYRDRGVFDLLRDAVLPELARQAVAQHRALRCWSAGCASGEEPYTLALTLRFGVMAEVPSLRFEIVATDFDEVVLERARIGCYPAGALRELPVQWRERAFAARGDQLCLRPELRGGIEFLNQDLRRELPEGPFDLVLCRNFVFTYFDVPLQQWALERMIRVAGPDAVWVIGAHEALPPAAYEVHHLHPIAGALPVFRQEHPIMLGAAEESGPAAP